MSYIKRIARGALAAALATVAGLGVAPPAQAVSRPTSMRNYGSGLCAAPAGWYNGAPVAQTLCDDSTAQQWTRISMGNGYELLQNVASVSTYPYVPMCLDVTDARDANGTPLQVWACTNTPGMHWRFVFRGSIGYRRPYYIVQSRIGGRCMDVPWASLVDGEQLWTWSCSPSSTNPAQLWFATVT
jgi:hypothetical protein